MKTKMYYVYYVERCTPSLKAFKTKKARTEFINEFQKNSDGDQDNWIDFTFTGNIDETYTQYKLGE